MSHKFKWACSLFLEASHFKCIQSTAGRTRVSLDACILCMVVEVWHRNNSLQFLGGKKRLIKVLVIYPALNSVRVQSTVSQSLAIAAWWKGREGPMLGEVLHNR